MIRVGIIGAGGFAGGELIRLADQHPELELTFLGGSSSVGRRPAELHPGLRMDLGLTVEDADTDLTGRCDAVFLATPPETSARLAPVLAEQVACVIDLSGAFRIRTPELHHRWYPKAERPGGLADRFVYGVPELVGDQLTGASLISVPGCYATAITLGLAPLTDLGLTLRTVVVDGKSGSSGSGQKLRTGGLHPYRNGAITPYAPAGHRHAAEVRDFFDHGKPGTIGSLSMSAYGVSHVRGLLTSSYVFTDDEIDARELQRAYLRFYKGHRFVRVRRHNETMIPVPDPQAVVGSNYCDVTVVPDPEGERIVVLSALDNLLKGAAGQAVQALNRRYSLPEETGLTMQPLMPT
ncbi:N-acetyl-gamma-glutamyl-phosphate reductase [Streptomyces anthocyanicus]